MSESWWQRIYWARIAGVVIIATAAIQKFGWLSGLAIVSAVLMFAPKPEM